MKTWTLLVLAVIVPLAGCGSARAGRGDTPPFEVTDRAGGGRGLVLTFDPALPGYHLPVSGGYGTLWLKPTNDNTPDRVVFAFPGRLPLGLTVSTGDGDLLRREDCVEIRNEHGEVHVVFLPKAMHLLRKPFSIHWGIPK